MPSPIRSTIPLLCLLSLASPALGCGGGGSTPQPDGGVASRPQRFIEDTQGRALILRGMNYENHSKSAADHQPTVTDAEIAQLSNEYGMRFARHLIFWAAVEPEQGTFDDAYLDLVQQKLDVYAAHGVRVMLDMHQDIYGYAPTWGNGGAQWTIDLALGEPAPTLPPVSSWSNAYFLDPVTTAFDRFFTYEGPGRTLQDRYAASWVHVAERFRDHPAVVGYDIMNEPFPGSAWDPLELGIASFEGSACFAFDREKLGPFYQRVIDAIRAVDQDHVIFYEPRFGAAGNGGRSYLPTLVDPRDGESRLAYAPHMYSVSYEANYEYRPSSDTSVERFEAARALEIREADVPLIVGEWGLDQSGVGGLELTEREAASFDRLNAGWAYWSYDPGNSAGGGWNPFYRTGSPTVPLGENANAGALVRMYPLATAGQLVSFAWDRGTRTFTMTFDTVPAVTSSTTTEIFLNDERFFPNDFYVLAGDSNPASTSWTFDDANNVLSVTVDPSVPRHTLTVMPRDFVGP